MRCPQLVQTSSTKMVDYSLVGSVGHRVDCAFRVSDSRYFNNNDILTTFVIKTYLEKQMTMKVSKRGEGKRKFLGENS